MYIITSQFYYQLHFQNNLIRTYLVHTKHTLVFYKSKRVTNNFKAIKELRLRVYFACKDFLTIYGCSATVPRSPHIKVNTILLVIAYFYNTKPNLQIINSFTVLMLEV